MEDTRECFVIMPFGDAEGYDKGHFSRVYEHLIKPACEQAGFKAVRADDTSKANVIIVDILQKIYRCDMAICDMSSRNPNVFYELGFRQAFNKKTVLIKDRRTDMPFDISGIRTLTYNESLRIDEVENTVPAIAKCLEETYRAEPGEASSLLQLLSVEKPAALPEKVVLSQDSSMILSAIKELNSKIDILSNPTTDAFVPLPNGEVAKLGDELYLVVNGNHEEIGKLIRVTQDKLFVKNRNGVISSVDRQGSVYMSLTIYPF